jgi:hypothetical protein
MTTQPQENDRELTPEEDGPKTEANSAKLDVLRSLQLLETGARTLREALTRLWEL